MHLKKILIAVGILGALVAGAGFLGAVARDAERATDTVPEAVTESVSRVATITIEGIVTDAEVSLDGDDSVLDILKKQHAVNPQIALVTKEYGELGVLVTSMGGLENGTDDKYWQYTVNDVMPQVGASALLVQSGDDIRWYFGASEF